MGDNLKSYLGDQFWLIPETSNVTMTTKQYRDTLLYHDGVIIARGRLWDITGKSLGAGVYRVSLKARG